MVKPNYWVDDKIKSAFISSNNDANSLSDKNYEEENDSKTRKPIQIKKESSLNKSTDSKFTSKTENKNKKNQEAKTISKPDEKLLIKLQTMDNIHKEEEEDIKTASKGIQQNLTKLKTNRNSKLTDKKLKTLIETEEKEERMSNPVYYKFIIIIYSLFLNFSNIKESHQYKFNSRTNTQRNEFIINMSNKEKSEENEWDKILIEPDEEEKKKEELNNSIISDLSSKKKKILKIDTTPQNQNDSPKHGRKKDKNDFIKDEKLKEKLDKLTRSIMDKDSSIDSHSLSRNTFMNKNDVDWKAKRTEFLEKLKMKKTEEEIIKKKTLEENNIGNETPKKPEKSRKCVIF